MIGLKEAEQSLTNKNFELAVDLFRKAAEAEPENASVCQGLAEGFLGLMKYDEASHWALKALDLDSRLPIPHVILAYAHYHKNESTEFEAEAQRAIETDPNSAEALACYGTMLMTKKKFDESVPIFKKALAFNPTNSVARRNIVTTFLQMSDSKEGYRQAKKMFQKEPSLDSALAVIYTFHRAYWVILSTSLLALIGAAILSRQEYLLLFPLLYFIFWIWQGFRIILMGNRRSGAALVIYCALLIIFLYLLFRAIP